MNPQLSYQLAQAHQQNLYRASEKARMARAVSRRSRFSVLRNGLRSLGLSRPQPQPKVGATRPVAGGLT